MWADRMSGILTHLENIFADVDFTYIHREADRQKHRERLNKIISSMDPEYQRKARTAKPTNNNDDIEIMSDQFGQLSSQERREGETMEVDQVVDQQQQFERNPQRTMV